LTFKKILNNNRLAIFATTVPITIGSIHNICTSYFFTVRNAHKTTRATIKDCPYKIWIWGNPLWLPKVVEVITCTFLRNETLITSETFKPFPKRFLKPVRFSFSSYLILIPLTQLQTMAHHIPPVRRFLLKSW